MELCRNLTHSLCDYERKNRGGLSKLQAIVMWQSPYYSKCSSKIHTENYTTKMIQLKLDLFVLLIKL